MKNKAANVSITFEEIVMVIINIVLVCTYQDFYVVDASENQVFLAVTHDRRTTHLYISGTSGRKYSLSLERVLYFSPNTTTAWLR